MVYSEFVLILLQSVNKSFSFIWNRSHKKTQIESYETNKNELKRNEILK